MGDNLAQLLYTAFVNSGHEVAGSDVPNWASLLAVDRDRWEQVAARANRHHAEKQNDEIAMLREANAAWQLADEKRKGKARRATAYAVLIVKPGAPAQIVGAGIFGEPHPTTNGERTVPLFDMDGEDYSAAAKAVGQHLESSHYDWCGVLKHDSTRGVWRDARQWWQS